ncbi:MAG: DOMON-like domain-containing protein [Acaryochloridaceae cyanobacterium RL_2_7]|nr:DOMON-like domain-containing protein [Acaryochloridaceae cyanobacterium RL_2_7]
MKVPLTPFPDGTVKLWEKYELSSDIAKTPTAINIEFHLTGDLSSIIWPEPESPRQRQDHLWETTCFELFFGPPNSTAYWEVNLAPSGHWNVYAFDDYRAGMKIEAAIATVNSQSSFASDEAHLTCSIPLNTLRLTSLLEVSITAVLALKSGEISYWAVKHVASEADFHQRASFCLRLP